MILKKPQAKKQKTQAELELQGGFLLVCSFMLNMIFFQWRNTTQIVF